jgi:hypothetical protein
MKKIFSLFSALLFIAVVLNSCSKSHDSISTSSSMKFTANGTAISFPTCLEVTATLNGNEHLLITGENTTATSSFEVEIIHALATLQAGQTYQVSSTVNASNSINLYYFTTTGDSFQTQAGNPQGTVTITGVTSNAISGTFSGKLFAASDFSGTTVLYTVTNGSFNASITK